MTTAAPNILVVDDDAEIRQLVGQVLTREGYRVSEARDTGQARSLLADRSVSLIVLDLMLPGEDGLSFCRALRGEGDLTLSSDIRNWPGGDTKNWPTLISIRLWFRAPQRVFEKAGWGAFREAGSCRLGW